MTKEEKYERMCNCNHVFVVIKDFGVIDDPVRECIKCGMTNKKEKDEKFLSYIVGTNCLSDETILYHQFMEKWEQTYTSFHQLSEEELGNDNPHLLYRIAKTVNLSLDINYEEAYPMIFKTMKDLVSIVNEGKFDLNKIDDIKYIILIYNNRLQSSYKKGIK